MFHVPLEVGKEPHLKHQSQLPTIHTHAIISRGLYFFYPIFTLAAAYIADNLCTKNGNSSFFKLKIRGLETRAASNRERLMMAHVRYLFYCPHGNQQLNLF